MVKQFQVPGPKVHTSLCLSKTNESKQRDKINLSEEANNALASSYCRIRRKRIKLSECEMEEKKEEDERIIKRNVFSNKICREDIRTGDHIYSWRHAYIYAHHGIYIGDGMVIHFTPGAGHEIGTGTVLDNFIFSSSSTKPSDAPCPNCNNQSGADGVLCSCLDCFLSGGELYLFSYDVSPAFFLAKARGGTCTLAKSDPAEDVLHRALYLFENGFGAYNLFRNNCEDFAIYCKTGLLVFTTIGVGRSGQVASYLAAASVVVSSPLRFLTTSFSGLSVVGCGMYCVSRFVSDIGIRRDVTKIPVELLIARASDILSIRHT